MLIFKVHVLSFLNREHKPTDTFATPVRILVITIIKYKLSLIYYVTIHGETNHIAYKFHCLKMTITRGMALDWCSVFAPAKMNWESTRMYNTIKRVILYVLYGLIFGVCGLLDTLWANSAGARKI